MIFVTSLCFSQGMYILNYTVSFTTGEARDYISNASFRGMTLDGRSFLNEKVSLGGSVNWATFFENPDYNTFTHGPMAFTGTQNRYINAFPVLFTAHYYFNEFEAMSRVYIGGGIGTYKIVRRTDMGVYRVEDSNWHIGFAPEIGVLFPFAKGQSINVNLKFNYAIAADETIDYQWFGLSVGYAFWHYSFRK